MRSLVPFLLLLVPLGAVELEGWQRLEVLRHDGFPSQMRLLDSDGDGRDEILLVNPRQSRLDILRWLPAADREARQRDPEQPNALPLPEGIGWHELDLEEMPVDALLWRTPEAARLLVLVGPPNQIVVHVRDAEGRWVQEQERRLLPGSLNPQAPMQLIAGAQGPELLIACVEGVQILPLADAARVRWLRPRERMLRRGWWLADLDGDGHRDLLESVHHEGVSLRWYPFADGLRPAQPLSEREFRDVVVLRSAQGADEILALDGRQADLVRRYRMARGEASPFGERWSFTLPDQSAPWTGAAIADSNALVVVDPAQPRLLVHRLTPQGWSDGEVYPSVKDVQALVSVPGLAGTLLLWCKEGSELFRSDWEDGRFGFPQQWRPEGDEGGGERRILGLGREGSLTWWVQKVGADLVLRRWSPSDAAPRSTRFADVAGKALTARWIGGERLLVQDQYARGARLVALAEGTAVSTEPPQLKTADPAEFRLLPAAGGSLALARVTDGVLQWLDDELQATDQVMLDDGQRLSDAVMLEGYAFWALEQGGRRLHRMQPDEGGVQRVVDSHELPGGQRVLDDPDLGLLLVDGERVMRLAPGEPWELELLETLDGREGRPIGVHESAIHRLMAVDVDGDGNDEALLCDDRRHQLTLLARVPVPGTASELRLQALMSWPIFEDHAYPYGGGGAEELYPEPRAVAFGELDGDGRRELVMLCHDRILIYFTAADDGAASEPVVPDEEAQP